MRIKCTSGPGLLRRSARMRRNAGLAAVLAFFLFAPRTAFAAEVAIVLSDQKSAYTETLKGFVSTMKQHGAAYLSFNMKGDTELGYEIIKQIKFKRPRVIVAMGSRAASITHAEIRNIDIIYCMVVDPLKYGLKGKNIIGVRWEVDPGNQFAFMKKLMPDLKVIGVIHHPEESGDFIGTAKEAASRQGIILLDRSISSPWEISENLKELLPKMDVFWYVNNPSLVSAETFQYILSETFDRKIPILAFSGQMVKKGALVSLSPEYRSVGSTAARMAVEIVKKGKSIREVPRFFPEGEVTVNQKSADHFGISIPADLKKQIEDLF